MQEAIRIFSEMTVRGVRPCIVTYNTFIAGYAARGMFAEIDDVIEYMFQHDYRPNELTCKIIVDGFSKAGKYEEAMEFLSKIKELDDSFDEECLRRLASRVRESLKL